MTIGHRIRPGTKKVKANLSNLRWTSTSFSNNAKSGVRVNWNTKRGLSLSIPGTGLFWRNANYNKKKAKKMTKEVSVENEVSAENNIGFTFVGYGSIVLALAYSFLRTHPNPDLMMYAFTTGAGLILVGWAIREFNIFTLIGAAIATGAYLAIGNALWYGVAALFN